MAGVQTRKRKNTKMERQESELSDDDSKAIFHNISEFSDVDLIVEGKKIPINKWFLCLASPVFKTMFTTDFKEKNAKEVTLEGKMYSSFTLFLQYLRPGNPNLFTDQDVFTVLPLAHEYQVEWLVDKCQDTLVEKYFENKGKCIAELKDPVYKLLKFIHFGDLYGLFTLAEKSMQYLSRCQLTKRKSLKEYEYYKVLSQERKVEVFERRVDRLESFIHDNFSLLEDDYALDIENMLIGSSLL